MSHYLCAKTTVIAGKPKVYKRGLPVGFEDEVVIEAGGLFLTMHCETALALLEDLAELMAVEFTKETEAGLPSQASTQAVAQVEAVPGQEPRHYEPPTVTCQVPSRRERREWECEADPQHDEPVTEAQDLRRQVRDDYRRMVGKP